MPPRDLGRQRPPKRPTELQERDYSIFRMLKKAKILTTGDFVPLVFDSLPTARRRLYKLVGSGYVAAYTVALHEETRYMLDRRGMVALQEIDEFDAPPRSAPKKIVGASEHHLMLVRFWSRVVAECHAAEDLLLRRFSFEWELQEDHLPTVTRSRPDAIMVVEDDEDHRVYLVEMDTGTESPTVVRSKFDVFARVSSAGMPMYGEVPKGLLVLTISQRRLVAFARGGIGAAALFGRVFEAREEGFVLSNDWYRLRDLEAGGAALAGAVVRRRGAG